jgi:predicted unusual protein kinase regulating ubiquinone biosynthesis (AarF/ABC1/UbiB family)
MSYKLHAFRNMLSSQAMKDERLHRLHARNAQMLREKMVEQRGVFIKIGQFMSSRVDLLPEEYTVELSKLQDQVPPAPFSEIRKRVVEELGPIESVFSSFDEVPIASASLGQAHRACLREGECIVVKVQYPGIEDVIAADMRTIKVIMRILRILYTRVNLDVIYAEFTRIVMEELDYLKEGRNAETFARNFAGDERIKIPLVYWPYTTAKVLSLEYLEGTKISDLGAIDRQGIDRKEVARLLAGAYAQMFFRDGFFHGDPHPGNIFVRTGPEIVFVDFGMVDRISAPKRDGLRRAFTAIVDSDSLGIVRALVDMGFIPLTRDIQPLVALVDRLLAKYRDMSLSEFKAMDIDEIGDDVLEALRISPSIQIPNDFILFGRVVGMLNGLGSRLDPDTNLIEIAAPFAKQFIRAEKIGRRVLVRQAEITMRSLVRLPKLLDDFLVTTGRGELRVEIGSRDIVRVLQHIHSIGRGFILSIFAAGAVAAAVAFRIARYATEAMWCAVAAGVLFVLAIYFMRKARKWD